MDVNKKELIRIFRENVKGKKPDLTGMTSTHDGKKGHWLERQFHIEANCDNAADILGYELKNETRGVTTFGDWSANKYIFTDKKYSNIFYYSTKKDNQNIFCRIFGKANENGRYSWSGTPIPKYNQYNNFGQIMVIEGSNLDIVIYYSFSKDLRLDKHNIIPKDLQYDNIELARWYGLNSPDNKRSNKCLKDKLEDKFNVNGWFTCKTDKSGCYEKICFGKPMNFLNWIELVKKGIVYFDSGMHENNYRPYSEWRASNTYWNSLIDEDEIYY